MATAVVGTSGRGRSSDWATRYPPLLSLAVAVLIAVIVLPSALNLPQTNPTQTLEFAPVPPSDEDTPPPPGAGNLSSLGLAGSGTLDAGPGAEGGGGTAGTDDPGDLDLPPPPSDLPVVGKTPSTKRCVGNPPKQTEDPLSPPCVANFSGDNFGSTYQGVTGEEVRILIYEQGNTNYLGSSGGSEVTPDNQYFDLGEPPEDDEHVVVRAMRVWQQYFNERYQTYGRHVRFYVYFSGAENTPEVRRADAADNYAKVKPFAVLNFARGNDDVYLDSMAKRGVLNFGSFVGREASFFSRFPKLIWGFFPSLEQQAAMYSSYLCTKVANHNASFSANPGDNGKPRKYGLWRTRASSETGLQNYAKLIKSEVAKCGIEFAAEHTFPSVGFTQDNRFVPTYATSAVADFREKGVTTIIWPGGLETNFSRAAQAAGYFPEIIISGDRIIENSGYADDQQQRVWDQVTIVSNVTAVPRTQEQECFQAYRETDPSAPQVDITFIGCRYYQDLRQLFIGIQVAGPRLGPTSVDKGFHAIPAIPSNNPRVPACFYLPGDYTCVKDAQVQHYDAGNQNGAPCYRMAEGGQRYIANQWPEGDVMTQQKPTDPCNQYSTGSGSLTNPNPPDPNNPEG